MTTPRPDRPDQRNAEAEQLRRLGLAGADPDQKGMLRIKRPGAQQFGGWRGTVVGLALVAAMMIGYYAGQSMAPVPSPLAVVFLHDSENTTAAILEVYRNHSIRLLPLAQMQVPSGQVLQLWTWQGETAVPLAVLGSAAETTLTGPELAAPRQGQLYSMTLEPRSATPEVTPTGAVILSGEAVIPVR